MTKRVCDLGRKWNAKVPRGAIARLVNRQHAGMNSILVAELIKSRCNGPGYTKQIIAQCVAYGLLVHAANGALYARVMGRMDKLG